MSTPIRLRALLGIAAAASAVACTDLGTDPDAVVALEFNTMPAPSVIAGDSLRDSSGVPVRLAARAFNYKGDEIANAPFTFFTLDTLVEISDDGFVVATAATTGRDAPVQVYATTGTLQSLARDLFVVSRPDRIAADGAPDTLRFGTTASDVATVKTSDTIRVVVTRGTGATVTAVRRRLVDFRLEYHGVALSPSDATIAQVVDSIGRPSIIDTTFTDGKAERYVRVQRNAMDPTLDSVIVLVSTRAGRSLVPGSPVRIVLPVRRP